VNPETNGQISYPPAIRLRDGQIAFATMGGVALFDPAALPDLTNGPPVYLESLHAGGLPVHLSPRSPARISPPHRSVVDLHFAAVSFRSPDRTRFRYRLLGLSADWVDAGALRQATYANLRPGAYTFEVTAANYHGYWSTRPACLDFVITPTWHELLAVRWAGALAMVGLVAGAVRWRLRHVRRVAQLEQQAALARHRARLAKDLHDGLGGSLTELSLLSGVGESQALPPEVMARRLQHLARTTHDALHSLRDIIWSTTPKADSLEALVSRILQVAERTTEAAGLRCRFDFPPELPAVALDPELRKDLLFAVSEAVHNAVRHAHASSVHLRIRIEDRWLEIEIEDDGQGFDVAEVERRSAAPDRGLGLASVRERVTAHGGLCNLWSRPGRGTRITLRVPLPAR
jgi:signal transduction histidine kinase